MMHAGAGGAPGLVKIGRSWSPQQRCSAVQRSCPMLAQLELRAVFPDMGFAETLVMTIMRRRHPRIGRSEWLACSDSDALEAVAAAVRAMREIHAGV